jgi:hypothetical protein
LQQGIPKSINIVTDRGKRPKTGNDYTFELHHSIDNIVEFFYLEAT